MDYRRWRCRSRQRAWVRQSPRMRERWLLLEERDLDDAVFEPPALLVERAAAQHDLARARGVGVPAVAIAVVLDHDFLVPIARAQAVVDMVEVRARGRRFG